MGKNSTILVVDDFKSIRKVVSDTLHNYGFKTIEAENGQEALAILNEEAKNIDLILSDYNMPSINGQELLEKVKENSLFKNIPFVLLTSENDREKIMKAKEVGLDAWIQKPYKIKAFVDLLNYTIEKGKEHDKV